MLNKVHTKNPRVKYIKMIVSIYATQTFSLPSLIQVYARQVWLNFGWTNMES